MQARRRGKSEIGVEELMKKKFRAKCRFRAFGRMVMDNAYWLIEDVDHYEGLDDVKRRVEQAVRSKTRKQTLTITDKALLNKPATMRTDLEKKYLYRILGNLKCFKRYPTSVKKKLAALLYFKYYGPGRVIVRQHQEAHAIYFVLTGEVIVSHLIWDELEQADVPVNIGVMHSGDMFGEVSLLNNIPRTATCITNDHCEMLALLKEDFENVLQACVQKQWDEVQRAMSSFSYFDGLDEVSRREGCIVAKMKTYEPDDIILGDGKGLLNYVYFILSGQCQMIEMMQVKEKKHLDNIFYTLYDPYVPEKETELDLEAKYFANYDKRQSEVGKVEEEDTIILPEESRRSHDLSTSISSAPKFFMNPSDKTELSSQSVRINVSENEVKKTNGHRIFFMQVCLFNPGSSFGFGENMRDRRIVALNSVTCMMMPKLWLLQKNTANIWTRIRHYLDKKIPTKAQLFKEFVSSRQWIKYREQIIHDVVSRTHNANYTSIHDVPYSIRMTELIDI